MKFYETNVIAGHLQSVPETEGRDFFFPINITCSCTSVDFAGMEVLRGWGLVACFISYFLPKKKSWFSIACAISGKVIDKDQPTRQPGTKILQIKYARPKRVLLNKLVTIVFFHARKFKITKIVVFKVIFGPVGFI